MEIYFINWSKKGSKEAKRSKHSFPLDRAEHLISVGNSHFRKADHWLGKKDENGEHLHPNWKEDALFINKYYGRKGALI